MVIKMKTSNLERECDNRRAHLLPQTPSDGKTRPLHPIEGNGITQTQASNMRGAYVKHRG